MKLRDHLKESGQTVDEFAEAHGWPKWRFRKWVYGQRTPPAEDIARMEDVTNGAVTLRDWLAVSPTVTEAA